MADGTQTMHSLGQPGESCEQCGSPLAADQRYCLNCGKRRGAPRVDYREQMLGGADTPDATPAPAQPQPPADPEPKAAAAKGERDYAPLAAVGGIAVLGLMLLVGVLIGKGTGSDTAAAPAPIVRVGGGEAESSAGDESAAADTGSKDTGLGGSGGGKSKQAKGGGESGGDEAATEASTADLEQIAGETGEEAAKNALKLPDKIATPGAPPPIDKSKPPGGGEGGGMVIK